MQDCVIRNFVVQCRNLQRHGLGNPRVHCAVTGSAHVGRVGGEDEAKLTARDIDTGCMVCGQSDVC